jgi:hypothetical protein
LIYWGFTPSPIPLKHSNPRVSKLGCSYASAPGRTTSNITMPCKKQAPARTCVPWFALRRPIRSEPHAARNDRDAAVTNGFLHGRNGLIEKPGRVLRPPAPAPAPHERQAMRRAVGSTRHLHATIIKHTGQKLPGA